MLKKYFMPESLTWWSAIAEGIVNILRLSGVPIPLEVDGVIGCAFGIGLRRKMEE